MRKTISSFKRSNYQFLPVRLDKIIPDVVNTMHSSSKVNEGPTEQSATSVVNITDSNRSELEKDIAKRNLVKVNGWYRATETELVNLVPTTYLWDETNDHRSRLLYCDGMAISPDDNEVYPQQIIRFSLYFEPLPDSTENFWFWEETCEPYAFEVFNIQRNENDEYWFEITSAPS